MGEISALVEFCTNNGKLDQSTLWSDIFNQLIQIAQYGLDTNVGSIRFVVASAETPLNLSLWEF